MAGTVNKSAGLVFLFCRCGDRDFHVYLSPLNAKATYEVCMAKKGVVAVDRYLVAGRQLDSFPGVVVVDRCLGK